MGWTQSPSYFSAFIDTIADMANNPEFSTTSSHPLFRISQTLPIPQAKLFHPITILLGEHTTPNVTYDNCSISPSSSRYDQCRNPFIPRLRSLREDSGQSNGILLTDEIDSRIVFQSA
jgi:hypothetical protein